MTGATGGVGTVAIALLTAAGFKVAAATGKSSEEQFLKRLGAVTVLDRAEFSEAGKPLPKERWAGVVGHRRQPFAGQRLRAETRYGGAAATCRLAGGMDFPATVAPFILRGVSLLGIDSVMAPKQRRITAWERLGRDLDAGTLDSIAQEIGLGQAIAKAGKPMDGEVRGRIVVDVNR